MFKCKFALVFLVVLVVYLKESQGHHIVDKKVAKVPIVAAKVGIAKSVAAKIKLAAFKKWAATKAIVKAPFVLGKKAALLKIGAVKSLAAFKVAKAKKAFGFASKKVAPAVAAVAALPAAAVAALPSVSSIPAAALASFNTVSRLPAAALTAFSAEPVRTPVPVVDIYEVPVSHTHYQVAQPNAHYSSSVVSSYKDGSDTSGTYSNGYSVSLLPAGEVSSQYQYYSVPSATRESYGVVDLPDVSEEHNVRNEETDTEVIVPHSSYGVPN